jgi:glucokinase
MILAGDVGGTKTLIGLFELHERRPVAVDVRSFPTTQFAGLPAIISAFFEGRPNRPTLTTAAFGVAGPVINQYAKMTNVAWHVDAAEIARVFDLPRVRLLNDLEAMAYSLTVLEPSELKAVQTGRPSATGNIALIAAGTGLGEALLHRTSSGDLAIPSEGGHSDFAPRTDRDVEFMRFLRKRYGRAEIEHVLSGPGLLNLSDFTHLGGRCAAVRDVASPESPAAVSAGALGGMCAKCREALDLFVAAYGAAAGNLALTAMTTGGVFVGGGIGPRILPAFDNSLFTDAFKDKGPMRPLLEAIPVHIILNPQAALLGAAVSANRAVQGV